MTVACSPSEALEILVHLLAVCPQSGPGLQDFDVDREKLAGVLHEARMELYLKTGRI